MRQFLCDALRVRAGAIFRRHRWLTAGLKARRSHAIFDGEAPTFIARFDRGLARACFAYVIIG